MLICQSVIANELSAFKIENGIPKSISDIHFSSELVQFGLEFAASENIDAKLTYSIDGKDVASTSITLLKDERFVFPGSGRSVLLDKIGLHKFKLDAGNEVWVRHVLVEATPKFSQNINSLKSVNNAAIKHKPVKQSYNSIDTASINVPSTRSVGSKLYKELSDSVVLIHAGESIGTGSILNDNGEILTNWHVVGDRSEVTVLFKPKGFNSIETAENYLADVLFTWQEADLALLKLRNARRILKQIEIEDIDNIEIAEDVHAIGHPKGNFWTYTKGVISQIRPQYEWSEDGNFFHKADVIQTQTPINPGNSGGPLLNDDGKLVGVNSFTDSGADGLNYAVAATTVLAFLEQVRNSTEPENNNNNFQVLEEVDTNGDMQPDVWYIDRNANNVRDLIERDIDFDGQVDLVFSDLDENGINEMLLKFTDIDGDTICIIYIDENEDGVTDKLAYDFDLDGNIDKIEPI